MVATEQTRSFAYRPDIDGLRAVAVLAVILFHLGFSSIEGGFLGVDIFFVISGFLITAIIEPRIEAGEFRFGDFYLRRIRRLIPPAFVTVVGTFIACLWILTPDDFIDFSKSAIAALFSVSNIFFFTEAGYWDKASELKPLLHTWSLGVEEQFYLFWPALIALLVRFWPHQRASQRLWVFAGITVLGLICSHLILTRSPSAAFYLLPARFFEFSTGALFLFLSRMSLWKQIESQRLNLILSLGGLISLLVCFLVYDGTTPFPGMMAILPCFATGIILLAGSATTPSAHTMIFSSAIMVWLGQLSYSLYLVHWPVVSLMRYELGLELTWSHQIFAAGLTLILAILLHYGVERPLSARAGMTGRPSRKRVSPGLFASGILAATLVSTSVAAHAIYNQGWVWRFDRVVLSPEQIEAGKKRRFIDIPESCRIEVWGKSELCFSSRPVQILFLGNSHEPDAFNFIHAAVEGRDDINLISFGSLNRCAPLLDDQSRWTSDQDHCSNRMARLSDPDFVRSIDAVVYLANQPFSANKTTFLAILSQMKADHPDLALIGLGGFLNTKTDCAKIINQTGRIAACGDAEHVAYFPSDEGRDGQLFEKFDQLGMTVIDRVGLVCEADEASSCRLQTPEGVPALFDQHHMSYEYSRMLGQLYAQENPDFIEELILRPAEIGTKG